LGFLNEAVTKVRKNLESSADCLVDAMRECDRNSALRGTVLRNRLDYLYKKTLDLGIMAGDYKEEESSDAKREI
jgi:hypothetical protein